MRNRWSRSIALLKALVRHSLRVFRLPENDTLFATEKWALLQT